jgi:uncharacterized protein (DUF2132 family)
MINPEKHNILDGVTLKAILEELVNNFGLEKLGERTNIRCFTINPTFNSSLKFLRKTPWARVKVENLYVELKKKK